MLQKVEEAIAALNYPRDPVGLYAPIKYVLSGGGKRLRPILLLQSYALFRSDYERALSAAVGIEIYHNHTLVHDDLMDNADIRRGRPTVHKKWNADTAVLSGDAMLLLSYRLIASTGIGRIGEVMELFTHSALQICEGQQYDVDYEHTDRVNEAEYLEMIRLKTSVLLGCAAKMGALLADAPAADADRLYRFAEKVGLAFQLQDDYLDTYGDPAIFGKRIGGDILCGKNTFLVQVALSRMDAEEARGFKKKLSDKNGDPNEKIRSIKKYFSHYKVPQTCLERINDYFEAAHEELKLLKVKTDTLWNYVETLLHRDK